MPEYEYIDKSGHRCTLTVRMFYSTAVICCACGDQMWRKPNAANVTWGGIRPSQGELAPGIKQHISLVEQNRERNAKKYGSYS